MVGCIVVYLGLVVVVSFFGMFVFLVVLFWSVVIFGVLVVVMVVVVMLIFFLVVFVVFGLWIEWLCIGGLCFEVHGGRVWRCVASLSMRVLIFVMFVTSVLLLVFGLPFLCFEQVVGGPGILPMYADVREVVEMLESGCFLVVVHSMFIVVLCTDESVLTREGLCAVECWVDRVVVLLGVERVEVIVGGGSPFSSAEVLVARECLPSVLAVFVSDHHIVVCVVGRVPEGSADVLELVRDVCAADVPGVIVFVGGQVV